MGYPKIMYDNLVIAECDNNSKFKYKSGISKFARAPGLDNDVITWTEFFIWISKRIVPRNSVDIDRHLRELNLAEYTVLGIAKETKASLMEDPFWVAFDSSDERSWRTVTLRGSCSFPILTYKDII